MTWCDINRNYIYLKKKKERHKDDSGGISKIYIEHTHITPKNNEQK